MIPDVLPDISAELAQFGRGSMQRRIADLTAYLVRLHMVMSDDTAQPYDQAHAARLILREAERAGLIGLTQVNG